jgi:hypothetical protein
METPTAAQSETPDEEQSPPAIIDNRIIYSVGETGLLLGGICDRKVFDLLARGQLEKVKIGRRTFATAESIHQLVAKEAI